MPNQTTTKISTCRVAQRFRERRGRPAPIGAAAQQPRPDRETDRRRRQARDGPRCADEYGDVSRVQKRVERRGGGCRHREKGEEARHAEAFITGEPNASIQRLLTMTCSQLPWRKA